MNTKTMPITRTILLVALLIAIAIGAYFSLQGKSSLNDAMEDEVTTTAPSKSDISYLTLPDGFAASIFADEIPGARVMLMTGLGIVVSQTKEGKISLVQDTDNDGIGETKKVLASGLKNPHGLEMLCEGGWCGLYVAESNAVSMYEFDVDTGVLGEKTKLVDLPSSATDRHSTRTLLFLPNTKNRDALPTQLLVSVGSSCDVCDETEQKGKILVYDLEAKTLTEYAKGLRNSVFMTLNPVDGKIFATEMGRDGLGDNIPPDEVNIIASGKNYGWPICYGKNIHDTDFDKKTYIRNPCMEPFETESFADLQAHSAPLGLAFIPEEGWDESYWYDLLVAYHGSWNRSEKTGYKIVRLKMDAKGNYSGTEDFITGWLTNDGKVLGRPADIKVQPGGTIYISDDENGVIYRIIKQY